MSETVISTPIEQLNQTGIYWGWFNTIIEYKNKRDGRIGHIVLEEKGELHILGNGQVEQGDSNHCYPHYEFDDKLNKRLELADEDGEDVYELVERRGWVCGDTKYVLIHTGDIELRKFDQ